MENNELRPIQVVNKIYLKQPVGENDINNHGDRYMIHQHKVLISQIIDYFCKRKRY